MDSDGIAICDGGNRFEGDPPEYLQPGIALPFIRRQVPAAPCCGPGCAAVYCTFSVSVFDVPTVPFLSLTVTFTVNVPAPL